MPGLALSVKAHRPRNDFDNDRTAAVHRSKIAHIDELYNNPRVIYAARSRV